MKFTLTLDKKVQARIDAGRCINCRECGEICPTNAISEYQKTVSGLFSEKGCSAVSGSCSMGCPMGVIPQAVASLVADGQQEKAYRHIIDHNPFAWVCAEVCSYPCHDSCRLRNLGQPPLDMRILERDVVRQADPPSYVFTKPAFDRIAIIGGGPAGIMAAFELRKAGYRPVIFEKRDRLGGAMSWGIPDFRLDKEKLHREIDRLTETGIEIRYNYILGENYSLRQIWEEGFAAVLLAVGKSYPVMPPKAGGKGIYNAVDILKESNDGGYSPKEETNAPDGIGQMGEKVVVIGNGRLAADTSQLLAAVGKKVVCITTEDNEKEFPEETKRVLQAAGTEVKRVTGTGQVISSPEGVKAIELLDGSRATNLFCDAIVYALGQKCSVESISKVETWPDGCVRIDEDGRTNKQKIYACGEVTGCTTTIVEALAAGRTAARAIDADLRGAGETLVRPSFLEAPAGETIYPENISWAGQFEAIGTAGQEVCTGNIISVLRAAGIAEDMPLFFRDEGPQQPGQDKSVAIIGGGIAGVTAAIALAKKGYRPVIFEKTGRLGGSCRWLATNRRFDRVRMERELAKVEESGIRVLYNTTGGVKPDIADLLKEYDAVLFAIGESAGKKPDIPGADEKGVFDIVSLMRSLNSGQIPEEIGKRVVVAGSDEISVDAARALKRICEDVTLLAGCGRGKLQIKTSAVDLLLDEGINILTGVQIEQIQSEHGRASSVTCRVLEHGSTLGVPCDTVVFGEGKAPDLMTVSLKNLLLDLDENGYIKTNSRLASSMRGVFAIGDFNMSSVDAGRAGAAAVSNYLGQTDQAVVVEHFRPEEMSLEHERLSGRKAPAKAEQDTKNPKEEARRCISCGYHKANETLCIGCGICQKYCLTGAIWMEGVESSGGEVEQ